MNIYDCFIFNGELELLELRLNILDELDCYFVIVEAGETFRNKPKPFYYEENKEIYEKWHSRIIYIKIPYLGFVPPLRNEWFSRNMFYEIAENAGDNDYFILSDVDEIPCPIRAKRYINKNLDEPFCFFHSNFLYKLNLRDPIAPFSHGSVVFQRKFILNYDRVETREDLTSETVGFQRLREFNAYYLHVPAGWHYSSCFSEFEIVRKLSNYSHPEHDIHNPEIMKQYIENRVSYHSGAAKLDKVPLTDKNCSEYILKNLDKYKYLIAE